MSLTSKFEKKASAYIKAQGLLRRDAPVLVALSGGADSVALLAVLTRLGYDCRAAHCNFHLRGEESMRDMRHCQAICEQLDVDLYIRDFDVEERRRLFPGESVEMACRELRYPWFYDLLDRDCAQAIAVGHHREDRVETFFLNLMRGAGIAGLSSMRPRSGSVVRPLLAFSRSEVEQYLEALNLIYITDSSNASDVHRRNRLRNTILPSLEDAFPGACESILRSISHLESANAIFAEAIEVKRQVYFSGGTHIDLAKLVECESEAATILFEFLRPLRFTYTQVLDILDCATSSGAHFRSTDGVVVAELSHGILELVDAARLNLSVEECYTVNIAKDIVEPIAIASKIHPIADFEPERLGASVAYIDADALESNPRWELRHYRRGDRIVPFGAVKSKLVSDLFAAAHYSASQKRQAWILTRNEEIVWIPGLRNSALFPVKPDTKRYIRLEIR